MKKDSFCFLFGAGAEADMGLPTGDQYTVDTMLTTRKNMIEALRKYYKKNFPGGVSFGSFNADKYKGANVFPKSSYNGGYFRSLVKNTLIKIKTSSKQSLNDETDEADETFELLRLFNNQETSSSDYRDLLNALHSVSIFDESDIRDSGGERFKCIKKNYVYDGLIERDFSTILSPYEKQTDRFWRIFNYYWGAYFSILNKLIEGQCVIPELEGVKSKSLDYYYIIIENISKISKAIQDKEFLDRISKDSYYKQVKKMFPDSSAITTNYTPFVENEWGKKSSYLSGKLTLMENPATLEVFDASKSEQKLFFPFIMTQAPIKPIISSAQIKEYAKAADLMEKSNHLLIIGYSLCEQDAHINSMLRERIVKLNKRIIFFDYEKEKDFIPTDLSALKNKLRIYDDNYDELFLIKRFKTKEQFNHILTEIKQEEPRQ